MNLTAPDTAADTVAGLASASGGMQPCFTVFTFPPDAAKLRTMTNAAAQVPGAVISSEIIPARAGWSRELSPGQVLRIIDLEGRQAVDFLCYNARDYDDRYAAADTMKINGSIFIGKGTVLYSVNCNPLFSVIEDTCGFHDSIGGCCSSGLNRKRYGKPDGPSCRQNFIDQLGRYGMGPRDVVANLNFFMYVPVKPDGAMDVGPSISKPGDFIDLRAETEVLAVISNCPQINNPVNDYNPTPVQAIIYLP